MPSTSYSTPAVTRATSGSMNSGMPGVVCRAMAVHTLRMLSSGTPRLCRKRRASVAGLQAAEPVDPARVVVDEVGGGLTYQLRGLRGQLGVGYGHSRGV